MSDLSALPVMFVGAILALIITGQDVTLWAVVGGVIVALLVVGVVSR
jgi:hypothetical protein